MVSTLELLRRLAAENAEFILVGGMACIAHGGSVVAEELKQILRARAQSHPG